MTRLFGKGKAASAPVSAPVVSAAWEKAVADVAPLVKRRAELLAEKSSAPGILAAAVIAGQGAEAAKAAAAVNLELDAVAAAINELRSCLREAAPVELERRRPLADEARADFDAYVERQNDDVLKALAVAAVAIRRYAPIRQPTGANSDTLKEFMVRLWPILTRNRGLFDVALSNALSAEGRDWTDLYRQGFDLKTTANRRQTEAAVTPDALVRQALGEEI